MFANVMLGLGVMVVCLLVFAAVLTWAILGQHVSFGRPWAFVFSGLIGWFWWLHVTGFRGLHRGTPRRRPVCV